MLEHLRRTAVREILVVSPDEDPIPPDLNELWSSGFKCFLTIVSASGTGRTATPDWTRRNKAIATLVSATADVVLTDILSRYDLAFPDQRRIAESG